MDIATSVFVVFAMSLSAPAGQGAAEDARWAPWLGCWEMVLDRVREGAPVPGDDLTPAPPPLALVERAAPRVCVTRDGPNTVKMTTTIDGQPPLEQTIVADGRPRPLADNSCRGFQRAEWSTRAGRLYSQAELTCGQEVRSVSSLSLIEPGGTWLDVRTVRIGTLETTRVGRYRRAAQEPAPSSVADSRYTLDDVKEGIAKVSPRVVEAALVETRSGFRLSSRQLIELADAHVPADVIDLIVALSYPERFVVERTVRREPSAFSSTDPFFVGPSDYFAGFGLYDDLGFLLYYCSPLSYSYLGRYDSHYYFVDDGGQPGSGGGGPSVHPSGAGRVINGLGYTQVRQRDTAEPSGGSTQASSSSSSSDASSGSSSGGGSVSSAGFSSGGGGDSGRTAVAR
jgi:hypothetical protein